MEVNNTWICLYLFSIDEFGFFFVKLRAVNDAGIGEAAYSNILAILTDSSTTVLPESTTQLLPDLATPTVGVVTAAGKPRGTDKVIVAAGVAGSLLFLVLVVIVFFFVRKRIRNKQREQSVKVKILFLVLLVIFYCITILKQLLDEEAFTSQKSRLQIALIYHS